MLPKRDPGLETVLAALVSSGGAAGPILDLLLAQVEDGVTMADTQGSIFMNAAGRRMLGMDENTDIHTIDALPIEMFNLHDFEPIPIENLPLIRALRGEHIDGAQMFVRTSKDPEGMVVSSSARPLRAADGRVVGGLAVFRDMSARKRAEEELEAANQKLGAWVAELERRANVSLLVNDMADLLQSCRTMAEFSEVVASFAGRIFAHESGAVYIMNPSRTAIEMTASFGADAPSERVFAPDGCWGLRRGRVHRSGAGATGPRCAHANGPADASFICLPMMGQGEALGILHLSHEAPPKSAGVDLGASVVESRLGTTIAVAEHIALALANLKLRETLSMQATRDPLTGLFNRRYMQESLERELARSARGGSLSVVMLDIDHFKRFNDTFGHAAADVALRETSAVLRSRLRADDIVCRFGGEEIVVILPDRSIDEAAAIAEDLRETVASQQLQFHGTPLGAITASFGVAMAHGPGLTIESLLGAADSALYAAKKAGRNRVCLKRSECDSPAVFEPRPKLGVALDAETVLS